MPPKRLPLIQSPTPLHRLERASKELGIDLWIKRDDLTGFALGGNKGRKLEYLMADAEGYDAVVTCGGAQSNFIRQLAAACKMLGKRCGVAAMELPYEVEPAPAAGRIRPENGNVLLDELLGLDLRMHPDGTWEDLYALAEDLAKEYEREGLRVYRIPVGGSSGLGAYGFYQAALECSAQAGPFDTVVHATSSGSTQTGLTYGFAGSRTRVLGISCDPEPDIANDFASVAAQLESIAGRGVHLRPEDFWIDFDYVGPGYGVPSTAGDEVIRWLAGLEGIFLDPVYSAKAFAGLRTLAGSGTLGERVLFWHTGGLPTLFAPRR